jgi:Ulp1 family protease
LQRSLRMRNMPKQSNGNDCGVFVTLYGALFSAHVPPLITAALLAEPPIYWHPDIFKKTWVAQGQVRCLRLYGSS